MDKKPTAGIILAGGMSRRLGMPKQLLEVGGSTVLSRVIGAAINSELDRVIVVLGHHAETIKASMHGILENEKVVTVLNPWYPEGMSTSLQCGLKEIQYAFPSIMILMGDQPLLSAKTINLLLKAFRSSQKDICVPVNKGKRGLPVCFTKRFYLDIFSIKGDIGARQIIDENADSVISIEISDPEVFLDIDDSDDVREITAIVDNRQRS
jgi:molybdenum cofactor cytidylyltransferase